MTEFGASAGIEVTASHNPINYNGLKIVKSGSRPLDDVSDFQVIKRLAAAADWAEGTGVLDVKNISIDARTKYVARVLSFVDVGALRPLRVVVNSGNGAAGPSFDAIAAELGRRGAPVALQGRTAPIWPHFCSRRVTKCTESSDARLRLIRFEKEEKNE